MYVTVVLSSFKMWMCKNLLGNTLGGLLVELVEKLDTAVISLH